MPRLAGLDAPGVLHHVMGRGIERKKIFYNDADMIICWVHDWKDCPNHIEVIELSLVINDAEDINSQIKTKKKLTEWQKFSQEKRLEGIEVAEIAKLWKKRKQS